MKNWATKVRSNYLKANQNASMAIRINLESFFPQTLSNIQKLFRQNTKRDKIIFELIACRH